MFVRSRKNLHTCKLLLAGFRSPLVKYARGSHIGFRSPIHHFGRPCWRRHGSDRVWLGKWNIFLRPQGAFPPGFHSLRGGWVHRPAPEAPLRRGMPKGPKAFLGTPDACGLRPCARSTQKKALCHTCSLGETSNKYLRSTSQTHSCALRMPRYVTFTLCR